MNILPSRNILLSETFGRFFSSQKLSGLILLFATISSLYLANSNYSMQYCAFWEKEITLTNTLHFSVLHFINEGMMTIFFFLVGLEIKRELRDGELKGFEKAFIPVSAALGGMLVPALIYSYFNNGTSTSNGWGIPIATDIAFAIGVISILGNRISNTAKVFITALAVVDDLGAVLVIAIYYSSSLKLLYLLISSVIMALLIFLNQKNVEKGFIYIFLGLLLWFCIFSSGIHSTLAGVLLAATIPFKGKSDSLLQKFEQALHKPVNLLIMPIFAMANTAIVINGGFFNHLQSDEGMGIIFGLALGKPIGITLFVLLTLFLLKRKMPDGMDLKTLIGLGFLGGIGFTMSIFISMLAFNDQSFIVNAKISIMFASFLAGLIGFILLSVLNKKNG